MKAAFQDSDVVRWGFFLYLCFVDVIVVSVKAPPEIKQIGYLLGGCNTLVEQPMPIKAINFGKLINFCKDVIKTVLGQLLL